MNVIDVQRVTALGICLLLAACSDTTSTTESSNVDERQAATSEESNQPRKKRAVATLGDDSYNLDRVFCVPGMIETVIASDSQNRTAYPEVKLIDLGENETGRPVDQASFDFRYANERVLWQLEQGEVVKDGAQVTASGILRGRRMLENADGTESSAALEGGDIRSFTAEVRCK